MLREAQALARLSHPHVVQVFEVGVWRDEVYLAMEYVAGETLRRWLRTSHPWRQVLDVLVQAGRGLQAAHEVELVHRDFKPDNVMVADDGRVRVLDFGLVRAVNQGEGDSLAETDEGDTKPGPFAAGITRTGSLLGTPNYMAPERLGPDAVGADDPRSDQFSFCATAYEALFGQRPYLGETLIDLMESLRGEPRPIPRDTPVARRVSAAILRGLARHPSQRWPTMAALLDELEQAVGRRPSPWPLLAAGGLAGALLAGSLALGWSGDDASAPSCAQLDDAALAGVWDAAQRERLHETLAATELAHASSTTDALSRELDAWASAWLTAQQRACTATHEQGRQSTLVLDRQQRCLSGQARRVTGLLDVLARPDADVLEHADALLDRVPEPARCLAASDNADVDDARVRWCEQPWLRAACRELDAGSELDTELAAIEGLLAVGKRDVAAGRLAVLADAMRDAAPAPDERLRVEALALELAWARTYDPALIGRWRALAGEAQLLGLDELELELRVRLAIVVDGQFALRELDEWLIADAQLALSRHDEVGSRRAALIELEHLRLLARTGERVAARRGFEALITDASARGLADLATRTRINLAHLEHDEGHTDASATLLAQARDEAVALWGPAHPRVAAIDHDLALLALESGDLDNAHALLDRAEAIHTSNPGSTALADDVHARAALALQRGELAQAGALVDRALATYEHELGPHDERTLRALELRGILRYFAGDLEGSLADYDRVLPGYEHRFGDDVQLAALHVNRGDTLLALGRADAARTAFEQARERFMAISPEHPSLAAVWAGLGEAELELGRPVAAIELLERATSELEPGELSELAEARFALARALTAAGREDERAMLLLDQARASFVDLGLTSRIETLDRWRGR
jgi:hypothetical protein